MASTRCQEAAKSTNIKQPKLDSKSDRKLQKGHQFSPFNNSQKNTDDISINKRDLIQVSQLIDLTDKPVGIRRENISWSTVKTNSSNCICCCLENSITLVTQNHSYVLDQIPIDNILSAQASADLQYLAIANNRKLVVVDLVDQSYPVSTETGSPECTCNREHRGHNESARDESSTGSDSPSNVKRTSSTSSSLSTSKSSASTSSLMNETKVVHLSGQNITMADVVYWRWLDNSNTLAILSNDALYTCSIDQHQITHPAYTALSNRSKLLKMQREFDVHQHLSGLCQVTNIQCDQTASIFAISSLYSTSSLVNYQQTLFGGPSHKQTNATNSNQHSQAHNHQANISLDPTNQNNGNSTLRPSFGSMPTKLSQLASSLEGSFESLKLEHINRRRLAHQQQATSRDHQHQHQQQNQSSNHQRPDEQDEICGLVQIHCKQRRRSQLIQTQAVALTSTDHEDCNNNRDSSSRTTLIAANKIGTQMRIHFVELSTGSESCLSGQNAAITTKFEHLSNIDFPTFIVCTYLSSGECSSHRLHVALITTKHGQLFVCSIKHSTVLFNTKITNDVISCSILERSTQGLMVICRNGQVLLAKLNLSKIMKLLDENKILRHISSSYLALSQTNDLAAKGESRQKISDGGHQPTADGSTPTTIRQSKSSNQLSSSLDLNLELVSTKL